MGCLRLNFWLPSVSDSGESIFWYFKYKYLHENSTNFEIAFRHVFWYQDEPLNEKNGSQKISLDCPFKGCESEALGEMFDVKNRSTKISWDCPFNQS